MSILKEGVQAPAFEKSLADGTVLSIARLRGSKVILYFYPKDDTPGCTAEACNLRDNYKLLLDKGLKIIGVSPDDDKSHEKFATKYQLPFPLLPDPELEVIKAYGVWGEKKMYGKSYEGVLRTTFVIDENGIVLKVFDKVDTKNHAEQILEALGL